MRLTQRLSRAIFFAIVTVVSLVFPPRLCSQDPATQVTDMNASGPRVFGTTMGGDIDFIDVATGGVNLKIPLLARRGRGLDFNLNITYSSRFWNVTGKYIRMLDDTLDVWTWEQERGVLGGPTGWSIGTPWLTALTRPFHCSTSFPNQERWYVYHDPEGGKHSFDNVVYTPNNCGWPTSGTYHSTDMTGMKLVTPQFQGPHTLTLRNGVQLRFQPFIPSGYTNPFFYLPTITDPNGNGVTSNYVEGPANGQDVETWTDTLGRQVAVITYGPPTPATNNWKMVSTAS